MQVDKEVRSKEREASRMRDAFKQYELAKVKHQYHEACEEVLCEANLFLQHFGFYVEEKTLRNKANQIAYTIEFLSRGKMKIEPVPLPNPDCLSQSEYEAACTNKISEIEKHKNIALELASIWEYALGGLLIGEWEHKLSRLDKLADALGIMDMIDAYASGVPVEDIIA